MNFFHMTWQQGWELAGWTMCYFLVAGVVVALAGAVLRFLCKRLAPQIRYTASLAVFAILAALPFGLALGLSHRMPVASVLSPIVIDLAKTPIAAPLIQRPIELRNITLVETPTSEAVPFVVAIARQNDGTMVGAIQYLPWVWLVGTPLTFLLLATGLIGSERLRLKSTRLTEGPIHEACQRLRTSLAVSQRVGIAISERIASPLLIGIVRPMILLPPAALTGWSPEQLEMVLLHELAHVRRWDNLVNFGQRLVESLLFFHPAVWWVSRWVRRDREECCDAVVVAQTAKPQAYAELLVALATPPSLSSPPLAGLAMAQHPLAGRIRRILHLEEEKMLITRSTFGLVGLFFVAVLGVVLWQPATTTIAQESNTPVALGSAGGLSEDKATKDTKSTKPSASRDVPASNQPSPFPTLESQRSADLAYKLLGLELEPLSKEELERVKAMKFAGGLRVSADTSGHRLVGSLLVGLHVWPITSLADVKKVLERDDLEGLSPLKFYGILKTESQGHFGGHGAGGGLHEKTIPVDKLVTGRIKVNIDAIKKDIWDPVPAHSPPQPAYFPSAPQTPGVITPYRERIPNIVIGQPIDPAESPRFFVPPPRLKSTFLYDGKTFDQWRALWKRELSIKNRTEAVRAMAAFGNAGRGKEAAKEILEIASRYNWLNFQGNSLEPMAPLIHACHGALGSIPGMGGVAQPLPSEDVLATILEHVELENLNVVLCLADILPHLAEKDERAKKALEKLKRNPLYSKHPGKDRH